MQHLECAIIAYDSVAVLNFDKRKYKTGIDFQELILHRD